MAMSDPTKLVCTWGLQSRSGREEGELDAFGAKKKYFLTVRFKEREMADLGLQGKRRAV